ncbi:MAG TPA: sulfite exporter TauE/SafE family protein, partial [Chitinophaga sp.]
MELLGYLASILIGISLGLTGSGGAVLTLPLLVYIFQVPPVSAITYSLFVVGASSLTGVIPKYRQGLVDVRMAFVFGAPSITAVMLTRKFIVPAIP